MSELDELNSGEARPVREIATQELRPGWSMNDERNLVEQIIAQRVNFFLVVFALIVGGAATADRQIAVNLILTLGVIVLTFLALAIWRTSARLSVVLEELRTDPTHPYVIVSDLARFPRARPFLYGVMPCFCIGVLAAGAILGWSGIIQTT